MKNSKTEEKTKSFDTVKTFREIKNKISEETFGMNIDDFKKYLNKKSSEFQKEQKALSANSGLAQLGFQANFKVSFVLGSSVFNLYIWLTESPTDAKPQDVGSNCCETEQNMEKYETNYFISVIILQFSEYKWSKNRKEFTEDEF